MDAGKRPVAAGPDVRVLTLGFTAGVLLVHALPVLPSLSLLTALALAALLRWRGRATLLCLVLGVALTTWRAESRLAERWPAERHGEEREWVGHVASLPERQADGAPGEGLQTWRFLFEPLAPGEVPSRIRVSWYRTGEPVAAAQCWRLRLRMRTPHGSLNPGGFDYEGWLFRQGVGAVATVRAAEPCTLPGGSALLALRQRLVERLHGWLPQHPAVGLVAALAVGDQSAIGNADWDVFRLTGTSHLVAISGLNIAIVAGFAFFLGRWGWALVPALCLRLPAQKAGLLLSALAAIGYALLAGFEPPVARAMLMLLFVLAAAWLHRLSQASRVLALAWLAILLLDPFAVLSPGLWLSFGAVAAIFYVAANRLAAPPLGFELVALQVLLGIVLMPLSLYFFHGVSAMAPLVNLVAVPVFSLLTPVLLLAILLALAWPATGVPLLQLTADALGAARAALGWAAQQGSEAWIAAGPPAPALLLALLGVLLLFAPRGLPTRPLALALLVPLWLPARSAPAGDFELHALDVGQGLAVVVRTARHTLLYDAGPAFDEGFDAGESVVAPFLLTAGEPALDLLVLSHGDNDHAGGVASVRRLLPVSRTLGTADGAPCRAGERWQWDGVRFEVLHPAGAGWSDNDGSCVLRIEGRYRALLAGDIEAEAEAALVREQAQALRAEVLVAPHHGSRTSSTPAFVAAVDPRIVVYGAAWRSHFGHPRRDVVARYAARDARQYVTGNGGAIRVSPSGSGFEVREWRREAARFWNAPAEALAP